MLLFLPAFNGILEGWKLLSFDIARRRRASDSYRVVPVKGRGDGLRDAAPSLTMLVLSLSLLLLHLRSKVVPLRQEGQTLSHEDDHQNHEDDDQDESD